MLTFAKDITRESGADHAKGRVCGRKSMEKVYQYLWKSRMFGKKLKESGGSEVEVIDPGRFNIDSGPDFFNSKVRVGDTEWAGNVEIHVKASDWYRHGHDTDPAYDSIILHAVGVSDRRVTRKDGSLIPQVEIVVPPDFFHTYSLLESEVNDVRCASHLSRVPRLAAVDWLESLAIERVQQKSGKVADLLKMCGGDWEQTCFIMLARGLGFGLNGDPFEMLARSIPLKYLHHHSDNPFQIQAILFGQAGMLDSSCHIFDEYYQQMCREYFFLARKYDLRPMRPGLWKYARTRPQNSPHRRIAFLAKTCEGGFSLFSKILAASGNAEALRGLFDQRLSGYWHDHFSFDVEARAVADTLSEGSVNLLLINTVAPLLYAYGSSRGNPDLAECALDLLESLPAETNTVTRRWSNLGFPTENALRSQAILQLQRQYCEARKCLYCRFGHRFLRETVDDSSRRRDKMSIYDC